MNRGLAGALLLFTLACTSRKVDVRLHGRPTESLEARAERVDGQWTVDLDLPLGQWTVDLPEEGLTARVIQAGGRPHARWETTRERLLGKPIRVRLQPQSGGEPIWMELQGRFVGQGFIEVTASFLRGLHIPG